MHYCEMLVLSASVAMHGHDAYILVRDLTEKVQKERCGIAVVAKQKNNWQTGGIPLAAPQKSGLFRRVKINALSQIDPGIASKHSQEELLV